MKYFIISIAILIGDLTTKWWLETPITVQHEVNPLKLIGGAFLLILLLFVISRLSYKDKYFGSFIILSSSIFCNLFDSLNGIIMNPFVVFYKDNIIGFNIADIFIIIGAIWIICVTIKYQFSSYRKEVYKLDETKY